MRTEKKTYQNRRDFKAVFACDECGDKREDWGYDDAYFHDKVIPAMVCKKCGATGGEVTSSPDVPAGLVL